MQRNWYTSKKAIILFHVLAWLLVLSIPYWLQPDIQRSPNIQKLPPADMPVFVFNLFWVILFYLNAYVFIPLLNKKKPILFTVLHVTTFAGIVLIAPLVNRLIFKNFDYTLLPHGFFFMFPYLFVTAISTTYRLILDSLKAKQLLKEKETEGLKSELSLLRSQVSPHFMFNVLNSMVSLARKKSDVLEPSLIKLSSLMRYMVYSSNEDKVLLQRELEYLQSYIDLQTLRFQDGVEVIYQVTNNGKIQPEIEPMLLIPFIENAFKHGTGFIRQPQIIISLSVDADNKLELHVSNKYNSVEIEQMDTSSGIGLANVTKRLDLLYMNNYELLLTKDEQWFVTKLRLNLS